MSTAEAYLPNELEATEVEARLRALEAEFDGFSTEVARFDAALSSAEKEDVGAIGRTKYNSNGDVDGRFSY